MSDQFSNQPSWQPNNQSAGVTDVVTQLQGIISQLRALTNAISGRVVFGTFAMTATAALTITQPGVQSLSNITLVPTNASAATLQGSAKYLYVSAKVPGASFTVSTANATNAVGTETFQYVINTPT